MKKAAKIKQPLTEGVAKVPVVIQMEAVECGAACLTMVLAYYSKWIPLEQVRADCGVSRDGSSAKNVLKAARSYGLTAKGYRYEVDSLKEKAKKTVRKTKKAVEEVADAVKEIIDAAKE